MSFMALAKDDAKLWVPKDMLRDAIQDIEKAKPDETRSAPKAIVIWLDDRNGEYTISFNQAGMKSSEILGLLEVAKATILRGIGHV
jgi:hypothetical protein